MPDVGTLHGKVDIDTGSVDRAVLKFEELRATADSKLEQAGRAFVTFGEKGEIANVRISSSMAKTHGDLERLEQRTRTWAESAGRDFEKGTTAVLKLGIDGSAALANLGASITQSEGFFSRLGGWFLSVDNLADNWKRVLLGLAAAIAITLLPTIAALSGALATLTLGLGVLAGLGGLGGGIVALAAWSQGWLGAGDALDKAKQKLDTAQEAIDRATKPTKAQLDALKDAQDNYNKALAAADNPFTKFVDHIQEMGKRLGEQAVPAATKILQWADSMIPKVEELGSKLISWFGPRLEPTLKLAGRLFDDIMTTLEDLGAKLTPFFDQLLKHPENFEKVFKMTMSGVVGAVIGFLQNLQRLADWWSGPEGQHMQSQAVFALNVIGTFVQALIIAFYELARAVSAIGDAFDQVGSRIHGAISWIEQRIEDLKWVIQGLIDAINKIPGMKRIDVNLVYSEIGQATYSGGRGPGTPGGGYQHGGVIPAGGWGRVGEVAEELIHAIPGGGAVVVPAGGEDRRPPGGPTIVINGGFFSDEAVARWLAPALTRELNWARRTG